MGAIQTSLAMQFEDADPELRASPAIVDGPSGTLRGFTFEQLEKCTSCLSHGLRELGVGEGSVVALMAPNLPEWALIFHATCALGAILLPCNMMLTEDELRYQLEHSIAQVVITVPSLFEKVQKSTTTVNKEKEDAPSARSAPHLFVIGAAEGARSFGTLLQTGVIDWEYEASDDGRGSMALMSDDLISLYFYEPAGETAMVGGRPKRQTVTHGELLDVLMDCHGGDESEEEDNDDNDGSTAPRSKSPLNRETLGLEEGDDVVAGLIPFWRADGLIGVMLQSCFKLCTVVTFDSVDGRSIRKAVEDVGITVLPATDFMLRKILRDDEQRTRRKKKEKENDRQPSTLCSVVRVTEGQPADRANNEDDDVVEALLRSWDVDLDQCSSTSLSSLTTLKQDSTRIKWPASFEAEYVMPSFFRQQRMVFGGGGGGSGGSGGSSGSGGGGSGGGGSGGGGSGGGASLPVTADITLVCSNGVVLESDQVCEIMECAGALEVEMKRNGMTVEASGEWSSIFQGLKECHELAHSLGSETGVHSNVSMSTTSGGGSSSSSSSSSGGGSGGRTRSGSQSSSASSEIKRRRRRNSKGSFSTSPLSPEMKGMHSRLQEEEETLKRERERHQMLKEKLMRTKNATQNMLDSNSELEQQMSTMTDGFQTELKRRMLKERRDRSDSSGSPRSSFSGEMELSGSNLAGGRRRSFGETKSGGSGGGGGGGGGEGGGGEGGEGGGEEQGSTVESSSSSLLSATHYRRYSTAPQSTPQTGDQTMSPVKEHSSDDDDDETSSEDEDDSRRSHASSPGGGDDFDDEAAMKEELEEDMRRLLQRGVSLFSESKASQAKPLFEEVVRIAHDLGNIAVEGRAVGNLASVFEATGQHHRAIELYMQCLNILRQVGDSRKEARILYNVSHSYLSLERYDESIDYLNQSLALTDDMQTRIAVEQQLTVVRHAMIQQDEEDDDRIMNF